MPRTRAILQADFPYHITGRCINRDWFSVPMPMVWKIFGNQLARVSHKHELKIHSFVLMSNHFHLIASTPQANISECMHSFMMHTSRELTHAGNRVNQTFAGRHFKCVLNHRNYFLTAYKYNYRNPVTARICERVEDYSYSSLQFLLGRSPKLFPLVTDEIYFNDPFGALEWLNTAPDTRQLEGVRYALKRPVFKSKKCKSTGRPLITAEDSF